MTTGYKIAIICGFVSLITWLITYSVLQPWWRSQIGWTLVSKTALLAALLAGFGLSVFFHLTPDENSVAGWADLVLICLITPVMTWRTVVWVRESRRNGTVDPSPPPRQKEKR